MLYIVEATCTCRVLLTFFKMKEIRSENLDFVFSCFFHITWKLGIGYTGTWIFCTLSDNYALLNCTCSISGWELHTSYNWWATSPNVYHSLLLICHFACTCMHNFKLTTIRHMYTNKHSTYQTTAELLDAFPFWFNSCLWGPTFASGLRGQGTRLIQHVIQWMFLIVFQVKQMGKNIFYAWTQRKQSKLGIKNFW